MKQHSLSGIYKIESKTIPERCYIGSSRDIKKRFKEHLNDLRVKRHHSPKLQRHYNRHGEDDLYFSVLELRPPSELIITEQYYLDSQEHYFNCYNKAGEPPLKPHSDKDKQKRSQQTKEYIKTHPEELGRLLKARNDYFSIPANVEKHAEITRKIYKDNPRRVEQFLANVRGKSQTEEAKRERVESRKRTMSAPGYIDPRKGRKQSASEIDKRVSAFRKTVDAPDYIRPINPETGRIISEKLKLYYENNPSAKEAIRINATLRYENEDCRKKQSDIMTEYYKTRTISQETRDKKSKSMKKTLENKRKLQHG